MKHIQYYEIHEVNGIITEKKILFKPKGKCKFYATLEYKWRNLHSFTKLETDHKIDRIKFARWSQEQLNIKEKEFYDRLVMTKLKLGIVDSVEPVVGCFKAYVIV
jgi:hypothetical protein